MTLVLAGTGLTGLQAQSLLPSPAGVIPGEGTLEKRSQQSEKAAKRLWQTSLVTLTVANVLDVQSSLGKRELNPALAGSSGRLGAQGILVKTALQGGLMGIEYLVTRSHSHGSLEEHSRSRLYRALSTINFAGTAAFAGIAAHNYTIPASHP